MNEQMTYKTGRYQGPFALGGDWDGPVWGHAESLTVGRFMGDYPEHFPRTQAKVLYDNEALYVIFHVEDRYVCARALQLNDPVCADSCVEFFFTPGEDSAAGYFNLEVNCGGTMLFYHQHHRGDGGPVDPADARRIRIHHSLPAIIDPEMEEPVTWTVEYRLPLDILRKVCPVTVPAPGVRWRANFYKCADRSSRPHWLTWSPVEWPRPDFHRPEFFGVLEFAD